MRGLPDNSVGLAVYSPPFESLYTFSDDPRDLSNCKTTAEFFEHYGFVCAEISRILMPGRLCAVHCMDLPATKLLDGHIGLRDFPGDIIRAHQKAGMIYHSRVMIRKDPVSAMQRTKSIGLLHKQLVKDSTLSRMAVADYIIMMRKPGDNPEPVSGPFDCYHGTERKPDDPIIANTYKGDIKTYPGETLYSIEVWQRYAESVWLDIAPSDVLSRDGAREHQDERHISPLQLTVIRRCIDLWSNPGDTVFSPFAGIGSELYVALEMGRRAIGVELKSSYYRQAIAHCEMAKRTQRGLFDDHERTSA
jgi:hypothetical protein